MYMSQMLYATPIAKKSEAMLMSFASQYSKKQEVKGKQKAVQ